MRYKVSILDSLCKLYPMPIKWEFWPGNFNKSLTGHVNLGKSCCSLTFQGHFQQESCLFIHSACDQMIKLATFLALPEEALLSLLFGDRVPLCSKGSPWIWNHPASTSGMLGLQTCATMPDYRGKAQSETTRLVSITVFMLRTSGYSFTWTKAWTFLPWFTCLCFLSASCS